MQKLLDQVDGSGGEQEALLGVLDAVGVTSSGNEVLVLRLPIPDVFQTLHEFFSALDIVHTTALEGRDGVVALFQAVGLDLAQDTAVGFSAHDIVNGPVPVLVEPVLLGQVLEGSALECLVLEVPEFDEQIGVSVLAAVARTEDDSRADVAHRLAKVVDFAGFPFGISQLVEGEENQAAVAEDDLACGTRWGKLGVRNVSSYGDAILGVLGDLRGEDLLGHVLDGESSRHGGG